MNTKDPEQARAFFIPVYLSRLFNHEWQQFSDPSDPWLINRDCHGLAPWHCWSEKWSIAINVSLGVALRFLLHAQLDSLCYLAFTARVALHAK